MSKNRKKTLGEGCFFPDSMKMEVEQEGIAMTEPQWEYVHERKSFRGGNMSRKPKMWRESTKKTGRIKQYQSNQIMVSHDDENDFVAVPDSDDGLIQLSDNIENFFPVLADSAEQKDIMEVDKQNVIFDLNKDENDEQATLMDVFDGSMDVKVKLGDVTVSEDALCQDVDLFAQLWPNLASEFLMDNWEFYRNGIREERERACNHRHGIKNLQLFSNLL